MSLRKRLQRYTHQYMQEHGVDEVDLDAVADWIINNEMYKRQPPTMHQQCKGELARALRSERFSDEDGNEIRRMHAVRIKKDQEQLVIWADIKTAKPGHMRTSLQQRRQAIKYDCYQHSTDTEWYNGNNQFGATLPLFDYDFNKDLEEMKLPTDYPESAPGDLFDDEDE